MIKQFAYIKVTESDKIYQEEKDKFDSYPGIVIKSHILSPGGHNYVIRFEHEKILTKEDFGVSNEWIIGEPTMVSINPPKYSIKNNT